MYMCKRESMHIYFVTYGYTVMYTDETVVNVHILCVICLNQPLVTFPCNLIPFGWESYNIEICVKRSSSEKTRKQPERTKKRRNHYFSIKQNLVYYYSYNILENKNIRINFLITQINRMLLIDAYFLVMHI